MSGTAGTITAKVLTALARQSLRTRPVNISKFGAVLSKRFKWRSAVMMKRLHWSRVTFGKR